MASTDTLAALGTQRGLRIGDFSFSTQGTPAFQAALQQFSMYTLPVFFRLVEVNESEFDFTLPDTVAEAAPPDVAFYIPGFSTDLLPPWLTSGNYSGAQLKAILVAYVDAVVQHFNGKYPGRVVAFEVVNEPLSYQGASGLWNRIGLDAGLDQYEYVRVALQTARAAAPGAKLYIDDFGTEGSGIKSDAMFELVSSLKAQNIPLDGVGLECHFMVEPGGSFPQVPPAADIVANMDRLALLGLQTMITSADIAFQNAAPPSAALDEQAEGYATLVEACLTAHGCAAFSTWGVGDADSWIVTPPQEPQFVGWGSPLLFDSSYQPKPAYYSVKAELLGACSP